MATDRQIEANRQNALLSTGPKSDAGKARSRVNARTHGLAAEGVGPDEAADPAFVARRKAWGAEYRPATEAAGWALDRAVAESFRIERSERAFNALIAEQAQRATVAWESDRRDESAILASRIARHPIVVSRRLETSRHGCEILIEHWDRLRISLGTNDDWTEDEASTALDLLGVHPALREGRTPLDPPADVERRAWRLALAEAEIDRLETIKAEAMDELDQLARDRAERGIGTELTADGQRLLRYERDAWRRYRVAIRDVGTVPTPAAPAPVAKAASIPIAEAPDPARSKSDPADWPLVDSILDSLNVSSPTESIAMIPSRC